MKNRICLFIIVIFVAAVAQQGMADIEDDLLKASTSGDVEKVKKLIKAGADVDCIRNYADFDHRLTPLLGAAHHDFIEVVKVLLDAGADVNKPSNRPQGGVDYIPLSIAIGHIGREVGEQLVELLIEAGSDVNWQNAMGVTSLMTAAQLTPEDAVKAISMLIEAEADPNLKDNSGRTALYLAVQTANAEAAKLLIDAGAVMNAADNDGITPFALAAESGLAKLVGMYLSYPDFDVDLQDEIGRTALMLASEKGHIDVVKLLLDAGADVKVTDKMGRTALSMAERRRRKEVVQLLTEAGAK